MKRLNRNSSIFQDTFISYCNEYGVCMKTSKLFTLSIFKFNHIPFNVSFLYWFLKNFYFRFFQWLGIVLLF